MRLYKVVAIVFYLIAGSISTIEIYGAIKGNDVTLKGYLVLTGISIPLYFIALRYHEKYRRLRKAYGELLDGKNIKRIDYMVKTQKFYRGGSYYIIEFYIEGKNFCISVSTMDCRNNKNNEYYLRPVYDRKGRVREFVVYMDKKNLRDKAHSYSQDVERYKEMERLKEENIEEKEEKNEKAIRPKPKLKHVKDNGVDSKTQEISINKIRKKTSRKMRKQSELDQKK
ncbi:hypothetical protein KYB31_17815 [Clostridium felsineum]|uniref:hypothetical protein n=1 Tax=Clostridium felsineum TaxID=36839 RepID=UPI00098CA1A3|nr:hypothetical protein [Clostridium felsineum]MCR3760832.1 hypothetical protein [Clostridium felsineum]URZ03937.1 hypothetical protein CLAUR_040030 [Clostridium felsineum]